jgi:hypothetical protein
LNATAVLSEVPSMRNRALSSAPVPATNVYVKVFPASGSDVESVPTTVPAARFSATSAFESATPVGDSLTFVTVIESTVSVDRPPRSVALTRIEALVFDSKSKTAFVLRDFPSMVNSALSDEPVPATNWNVNASSGSGSFADNVPTSVPEEAFSPMLAPARTTSVGASLANTRQTSLPSPPW